VGGNGHTCHRAETPRAIAFPGARAFLLAFAFALGFAVACSKPERHTAEPDAAVSRDAAVPGDAAVPRDAAVRYLGVLPVQTAALAGERAALFAHALAPVMGGLQPRTATSFEAFNAAVRRGAYDVVLIQPFDFVELEGVADLVAVARMNHPLAAYFVVREDASLTRLADLRGATIAMPPPNAAVSYMGRDLLRRSNLAPGTDVTIKYVADHAVCLQAVQVKTVAACVSTDLAVTRAGSLMGAGFRTLARSEPFPHIVLAAKRSLPPELRARIAETVVHLGETEEGRASLQRVGLRPFVAATSADFARVRAMAAADPIGVAAPTDAGAD
jgi:phosphonate transport system substrate-binding protein